MGVVNTGMALSMALIIQVAAVASIPVIFIGMLFSRMSLRKSFKWRQAKMTALLSLAPVLVVFAVRGLLSKWMALIGALVVVVAALFVGSGRD